MTAYEEYLSQDEGVFVDSITNHYDEHTDRWVDEASESVWGHSGHNDVHTDDA